MRGSEKNAIGESRLSEQSNCVHQLIQLYTRWSFWSKHCRGLPRDRAGSEVSRVAGPSG
jgi:hypothetical protein